MSRRRDRGLGLGYTDQFADRVKQAKNNGEFGPGLDDVKVTADSNELERGMGFSYTDYAKMKYDYQMWQMNNEYNEQLYNQYQSPAAMVRQYQDAGLNPALMYGGVTGNGSAIGSNSAPDSSSADYSVPQTKTDKFSRIMSVIASMVGVGSQLGNVITQAKAQKANAKRQDEQTAIEQQNADTARINADAAARKANAEAEDKENWNKYGKEIYNLQKQYAQGEIDLQEFEKRIRAVSANVSEQTSGNTIEMSNIGVSAATQELTNMEKLASVYDAQANALSVSSRLNALVADDAEIDHAYKAYAKENNLPNDPYVVVTFMELERREADLLPALRSKGKWLSEHKYMEKSSEKSERAAYKAQSEQLDELQGLYDEIQNVKSMIRGNSENLSKGDYTTKEHKDALLRISEAAFSVFSNLANTFSILSLGRKMSTPATKTPSPIITPYNRSSEWNKTTGTLWTPK